MTRLTIRTDTCCEPENDIVYSNPNDPEGMYNILDLAKQAECGNGTEANILLAISSKLAAYEDFELDPAELGDLKMVKKLRISEREYFRCENCKHLLESENLNWLYCSYHSDGDYLQETYKDDYCSYFESRRE